MRALVKRPNQPFEIINLGNKEGEKLNSFNDIKEIIGCDYVDVIGIKGYYDLALFIDEEGAINGSNLNFRFTGRDFAEQIFGTVVLVRTLVRKSEMYLYALTDEDIQEFTDRII